MKEQEYWMHCCIHCQTTSNLSFEGWGVEVAALQFNLLASPRLEVHPILAMAGPGLTYQQPRVCEPLSAADLWVFGATGSSGAHGVHFTTSSCLPTLCALIFHDKIPQARVGMTYS